MPRSGTGNTSRKKAKMPDIKNAMLSASAIAFTETFFAFTYCLARSRLRENTPTHDAYVRCTHLASDMAALSWTLFLIGVFCVSVAAILTAKAVPRYDSIVRVGLCAVLIVGIPWGGLLIDQATR